MMNNISKYLFLILITVPNFIISQKGSITSNSNNQNFPSVEVLEKSLDNSFQNYVPVLRNSISDITGNYSLTNSSGNLVYVNGQAISDNQTGGLYIYDVSNPLSPSLIASDEDTNTVGETIYNSIYYDGKSFLATDSGYTVLNDQDNYSTTISIDSYGPVLGNAIEENYHYISTGDEIKIISFDFDSEQIYTTVGSFSNTNSSGNYNYLLTDDGVLYAGKSDNVIEVYDISDPVEPSFITNLEFGTNNYLIENFIINDNGSVKTLYVVSGSHIIQNFDVTNPEDISQLTPIVSELLENNTTFYGLGIANNILYAGDFEGNKIYSFSILDPTNPLFIQETENGIGGGAGPFLTLPDNYLLSSNWESGFHVYSLELVPEINSFTINESNSTATLIFSDAVTAVGEGVEVSAEDFVLSLTDLCGNYSSTPPTITVNSLTTISDTEYVFDISIDGDLCGQESINLTIQPDSISNSENTYVLTDSITTAIENFINNTIQTGGPLNKASSISYPNVYIARGTNGYKSFDISNLTSPQFLNTNDNGGNYSDVLINENNVFFAKRSAGIEATSLSNNEIHYTHNTPGKAFSISQKGNAIYLSEGVSGILVYDVSNYDPATTDLENVNSIDLTDEIKSTAIIGNTLFAASPNSVKLVDISNPFNPVNINNEIIVENTSIRTNGDKLYAFNPSSISIYQFSNNSLNLLSSIENINGTTIEDLKIINPVSNLILVAKNNNIFSVIDINNIESPVEIFSQTLSSEIVDIDFYAGNAYVLTKSTLEVIPLSFQDPYFNSMSLSTNNKITIEFSEDVYSNINATDDLTINDFDISLFDPENLCIFDADQGFTFTKISQSKYEIEFTTIGEISGNEIITVNPNNSADSNSVSIYSAAGVAANPFQEANNTVNLVGPALISSTSISDDNSELTVMFDQDVFGSLTGDDLEVEDFSIEIINATYAAVTSTPTSISKTSNSEWVLSISITGTLNGQETIKVSPVEGSIFNSENSTSSVNQANNEVNVNSISDDSSASAPDGFSHNFINIVENFAYVSTNEQMFIYDPEDFSTVIGTHTLITENDNNAMINKVTVKNNLAYITSQGDNTPGMTILDISDKSNPQLISNTNFPDNQYYSSEILVNNSIAYVASRGLYLYDVSQPDSPSLLDYYDLNSAFIYDLHLENNLLYAASSNGFMVLDITDTDNVFLTNDTSSSSFTFRLDVSDNYINLAGGNTIYRYDKSQNPSDPTLVNTFFIQQQGFLNQIKESGGYLHVTQSNQSSGRLISYDLNQFDETIQWFNEVGKINNDPSFDLFVKENKAYIASGSNGINVYSLDFIPSQIDNISVSSDNLEVTVNFSKDVFTLADENMDLNQDNFTITVDYSSSGDDFQSFSVESVTKISNSEWILNTGSSFGVVSSNDKISITTNNIFNEGGVDSNTTEDWSDNNSTNFNDVIITITSVSVSSDNEFVYVVFPENVTSQNIDGSGISLDNFLLTLSSSTTYGNAVLSSSTPSSVEQISQSEWKLGVPISGVAAADQLLTLNINSIVSLYGYPVTDGDNNFTNINPNSLSSVKYIISQVAVDNSFIEINYDATIFSDNLDSEINVDDFILSIQGGAATLTQDSPINIQNDPNSNSTRLFIGLSGNPDGNERLFVNPREFGSIVDSTGDPLDTNMMTIPVRLFPYSIDANKLNIDEQTTSNTVIAGDVVITNNTIGRTDDTDLITFTDQGEVAVQGEISINSDIRLKTNIVSLGSTLVSLMKLDGKRYNMISDNNDEFQIGLLAQEVQKVFPDLVIEDSNGILSVNYQALIPVLVNALKEIDANYNELEKELAKLESLID